MTGMAVVHGIDALDRSLGRLFVVIGVFDGLHRGHLYLLDELVREATSRDARPAVITFDHHPDEVITGKAPPLLCDPAERLERLEAAGVAVTVVQTFDVALRETPYDAFIRRIAGRIDLAGFLMTPDSAFGYQRGGTPETVAALGRDLGFEVAIAPPFILDGQPVRSSAIRSAIQAGDLRAAERLIGRPYSVIGEMSHDGHAETVRVGFEMPVALPPDGRYQVRVDPEPRTHEVEGALIPGTRVGDALVRGGRLTLQDGGVTGEASRVRVTFESN